MKTDHLFYRLFKELPSSFFELIGHPASQATEYKLDSVELKQTAFRIDGLFLPLDAGTNNPIYFTEVQFQKDPDIYSRLFSEVFVYLRTNGSTRRWRSVVIFRSRSVEPNSSDREPYQPLLDSHLVQRIYLNELEVEEDAYIGLKIIQLVIASKKQVVAQVGKLVKQVQQNLTDEGLQEQVINLIETVVLYKLPQLSREELEAMLGLDDLKKTRFAQEMLAEGRVEGRAEGDLAGRLKLVPRLIARGFSVEEVAEITELEIEQVRQILEE